MPSPKHPCAYPSCATLVARKEAMHCRKHAVKTPEHVAKIAARLRGRTISAETRERLSRARIERFGNGPKERACEKCGEPFTCKPSSKRRFCSRTCGYANRQGESAPNWRDDMPTIECRVCGKPFRLSARTTREKRFACSHTCKNIWQLTHQPNKATNIERIMESALQARGMTYGTQVPLCAVTVADFYLPDSRTAIFCDGDYWHSLPEHIDRDGRQTATLEAAGYTVHRFLGSAILADVDACLTAVFPVMPSHRCTHAST